MSETELPTNHANLESVFARIAQFGRAALGVALDVALPPLCASCTPLGNPGGLCPACWSRVSFIAPPYCERLGIPFTYDPGPGILSMEAIADPPAYGRARAAVRYDDIARDLVHRLKYGDRLDLATSMGQWMARARHLPAGRFVAQRASRERPGRIRRNAGRQGRDSWSAACPCRRRADIRRNRRCVYESPAARRRPQCGRAGLCPGCRAGAGSHIVGNAVAQGRRECLLLWFTQLPIVLTAFRPRHCFAARASNSPKSTSGAHRTGAPRWWNAPTALPRCRKFSSGPIMWAAPTSFMRSMESATSTRCSPVKNEGSHGHNRRDLPGRPHTDALRALPSRQS